MAAFGDSDTILIPFGPRRLQRFANMRPRLASVFMSGSSLSWRNDTPLVGQKKLSID